MQKGDYRFPLPVVRSTQAVVGALATLCMVGILFALNIPGRIDSARFKAGLRPGLTHQDLDNVRDRTSGNRYGVFDADREGVNVDEVTPTGEKRFAFIWFPIFSLPCSETSDLYILTFDDHDRLQSWKKREPSDGC